MKGLKGESAGTGRVYLGDKRKRPLPVVTALRLSINSFAEYFFTEAEKLQFLYPFSSRLKIRDFRLTDYIIGSLKPIFNFFSTISRIFTIQAFRENIAVYYGIFFTSPGLDAFQPDRR
ncbi:MAG: hypothetical protein U9N45_05090 [Gemmatimonadota bacterium]|nr:hypothetical protein [Gemmatimonadota bacterium]